jgi:hypothetical protein
MLTSSPSPAMLIAMLTLGLLAVPLAAAGQPAHLPTGRRARTEPPATGR